jgi:predicted  nucleic acid-binding Zn-ribbon protein
MEYDAQSAPDAAISDADIILQLNDVDITLHKLTVQLESMPQRTEILSVRAKQKELDATQQHIATLRAHAEAAIAALQEQEEAAIQHRKEIQANLDESSDFKQTTALSHELELQAKRIEAIESKTLHEMEKMDKIAEVEDQAHETLQKLKAQEASAVEDFKTQGGLLQAAISKQTAVRTRLAARLPAALLTRYDKAVAAKGGIGAAHIEQGHCSACGMPYSEGQMAKLKATGELAECPHCHRLLVTKG